MVYELWKKLKGTSSRNEKERILKYECNEEFFKFAHYVLNPYMKYGITSKQVWDDNDKFGHPTNKTYDLLDKLYKRELTGNKAITAVNEFVHQHGWHILLALDKKLDCGVTEKTINKVYNGKWRIPEFKVQLAKEVPLEQVCFPKIAQPKYDGVRMIAIKENGIVTLLTRNGREIHSSMLVEQIKGLPGNNYVLDGELVYGDGKQEGRTSISGLVNSSLSGRDLKDRNINYMVFDILSVEEFKNTISSKPYKERFHEVRAIVGNAYGVDCENPNVKWTPVKEVKNADEANKLFEQYLSDGWEGIILKDWNHRYTFKRSKDWIKMKAVKSADLLCINTIPGTGKFEGMIGALVCIGEIEGKEVAVKVGSGLTEEDRQRSPEYYIGKTIEVLYNSVVDNDAGDYSLFLPRFVSVRVDK